MEREISISRAQAYYLIQHMAHQMNAIDDKKLKNNVHDVHHCDSNKENSIYSQNT